jgi:hypothetical protein
MQILYLHYILKIVQHDAHDSLEPHDEAVCDNGTLKDIKTSTAIASLYVFTLG